MGGAESAARPDEVSDARRHVPVVRPDDDQVVAVVSYSGRDRARFEAEPPDETQADSSAGLVAFDDGDLRDVPSGVGRGEAARDARILQDGPREDLSGDDLDHADPPGADRNEKAVDGEIRDAHRAPGGENGPPLFPHGPAVRRRETAALVDGADAESLEVRNDGEIGQTAGGDGPAVGEAHVEGGVDRGHPDGRDRIDSRRDGPPEVFVHMPAVEQVVDVLVVGNEEEAGGRLRRDQGGQGRDVLLGRSFADHDRHAEPQLFPGLLDPRALVVRADSRRDVRRQVLAGDERGVAVDPPAVPGADFPEDLRVPREDTGHVHHLRDAQDTRPAKGLPDSGGRDSAAGRLETGGRNAGGGHEVDVEGK